MTKQLNFKPLRTFMAVAVLATVMSCSNDQEEIVETTDLSGIQEELVAEDSSAARACSTTELPYSGPGTDVNKNVNTIIDDRSCVYNYVQTKYGTTNTWGMYRLRANTSSDSRETRIERASKVVRKVKSGNFVEITGTVRIARAGEFPNETRPLGSMTNRDGTYFIQAKGKDTSGNGSPDPAICLFIAKPIKVDGKNYFNIYREEIKRRGGEGEGGRRLTYITRVRENRDFFVKVKTGFERRNGKLRHYVNSSINGVFKSFTVPRPDQATQAKLRMGAYRCKAGEAVILWRNVNAKIVDK